MSHNVSSLTGGQPTVRGSREQSKNGTFAPKSLWMQCLLTLWSDTQRPLLKYWPQMWAFCVFSFSEVLNDECKYTTEDPSVVDKRIGCPKKCNIHSRCIITSCISTLQGTIGNTDEYMYFCKQTEQVDQGTWTGIVCVSHIKEHIPLFFPALSLSLSRVHEEISAGCVGVWVIISAEKERGERHSLSRRQCLWQQCSKEIPNALPL